MMWAGHVVQMEEGRLPKKAEAMKQRGLKEKAASKRDIRKAEEDDMKWKEKAVEREKWKGIKTRMPSGGRRLPIGRSGKGQHRRMTSGGRRLPIGRSGKV